MWRKFDPAPVPSRTGNVCMTEGMGSLLPIILRFRFFNRNCFSGFLGPTNFGKGLDASQRRLKWWFYGLSYLTPSLGRLRIWLGREVELCFWLTITTVGLGCSEWFPAVCTANKTICINLHGTCSRSKIVKLSESSMISFQRPYDDGQSDE